MERSFAVGVNEGPPASAASGLAAGYIIARSSRARRQSLRAAPRRLRLRPDRAGALQRAAALAMYVEPVPGDGAMAEW